MTEKYTKVSFCFIIASAIIAKAFDYDTALEIQRENDILFSGFKLEYSFKPNNRRSWSKISLASNDSTENAVYYYGSLTKGKKKNVYFRISKSNKISDVHFANVKKLSTNFIKQTIDGGAAGNNIVTDAVVTAGQFHSFETVFKLKNRESNSSWLRLVNPVSFQHFIRGVIHFSWNWRYNGNANVNSLRLIISDDSDNICQEINVINQSSYIWNIPASYPNGVYYWQINQVCSDGEIYESETRPFIISDGVTDTDGDGYLDIEELARGADPNDPKDIPLIITSPEECQSAYKDLQYFNVLKANRVDQLDWQIIGYLPEGLILSKGGALQGRPLNTGDYIFAVCVFDRKGKSDEKTFHLEVEKPAPSSVRMGLGGFR